MWDLQKHQKLSKLFLGLVLGILLTLLYFRYNEGSILKLYPKYIKYTDTTYLIGKEKPQKLYPVFIKGDTVFQKGDIVYIPSPDYTQLKQQYLDLVKKFTTRNIYQDSIKIGTYGHILVNDTIQNNKIASRSFTENYKIPIISNTVIDLPQKSKRKFFVGGAVNYHKYGSISTEAGLIYQTKATNQYNVKVGLSDKGLYYGIGYYVNINK